MYVTITRDENGRLSVRRATTPDDAQGVTVLVCPPWALARRSGTVAPPFHYAAVTAELAAVPVGPPQDETVADLNAATVVLAINPHSEHVLAIGPFTGPDRAGQWWNADSNRFAASGVRCHVLPLLGHADSQTGAQQ